MFEMQQIPRVSLDEILQQTGSHKSADGYGKTYGELFAPMRNAPIRLLEIGVGEGASLRAWSQYFTHPQTKIFGVDVNLDAVQPIEDARVKLIRADVDDIVHFDAAMLPAGALDVVIDDGSRELRHRQYAHRVLWAQLNPGGIYCAEGVGSSDMWLVEPMRRCLGGENDNGQPALIQVIARRGLCLLQKG